MRLNLGAGSLPLDGYVNVDAHLPADVRGDIRELEFSDIEKVVMYHLLEHLPHTETVHVLERVRSWMRPRAAITVEVPDMLALMENPRATWLTDIYGSQQHEGERHLAGFSVHSLAHALHDAGFTEIQTRTFVSEHPHRPGMPCIEADARA